MFEMVTDIALWANKGSHQGRKRSPGLRDERKARVLDSRTFAKLRRKFGAEYEAYCQNVSRWWPRLKGWDKPVV
jgi:hypothetical protein